MANISDMASSKRALGRYILEEPISTGATATIWRARDTRSGNEVAVKRFHPHLFADRVARKRMEHEANAALRVRARTVVSAIDRVATRDEFAVVFPFVVGTPLSERLREQPALRADEAAAIGADIADALAAIHAAGLVHRDVKPGNVLIGEDGRARLLDFGISHEVTDEIAMDQALTGAGLAIGTLPYMAPEQLAGEPTGPPTDVFALGVVLYEMLARERPFKATTPVALSVEQRTLPPRIAGAPEPLNDLALHALAIDPLARPSAQHLSVALRSWRDAPIAADAPTAAVATVPPLVVPDPPRKRALGGLATAALALAGVLVIAIVALAAVNPPPVPSKGPNSTPAAVAAAPTTSPTASRTPAPTASPTQTPPPAAPAIAAKPTASPPTPNPPAPPKPAPKHHAHHGHRHGKPHHGHHRH